MDLIFTADPHYQHTSIISYCQRPMRDVHEMNEVLQNNWNNTVTDCSKNYILGDFCFGNKEKIREIRVLLKGPISLILGNHDRSRKSMLEVGFNEVYDELIIETVFGPTLLTHKPVADFKGCNINFNGHVHEKWKFHKRSDAKIHVNVGCDVWNFKPISDLQIKEELEKWLNLQ